MSQLNDEKAASPHPLRELFPEYATAIVLGGAPEPQPELMAHLDTCPECRADLNELIVLITNVYTGQIPSVESYPAPDLGFLPQPIAKPAQPWLIDELGRLLISFSDALISTLMPRINMVGVARGQFLFRYVQDASTVRNMEVTIDVFAEDTARTFGRVRIGVDVHGRDAFDQAGSRVIVRSGDAIWQGETDETGLVDLAPIPLDAVRRMRVEITPSRTI